MNRLLRQVERRSGRSRPGGFSLAPVYLALGLLLGYQLLVRFVPLVWSTILPQGWIEDGRLHGLPSLLWRLALVCHFQFPRVALVLAGISLAGFVASRGPRSSRILLWLAAISVVLLDGGIVYITIKTGLEATMQSSGLF